MSPAIKALSPISCAIDHAFSEDQNYAAAASARSNGVAFSGKPADDLARPASRRAIFDARLADLRKAAHDLTSLRAKSDLERQFVSAARDDVRAAGALMRYDRRWAPGDPKAPDSPAPPGELSDAIGSSSAAVQKAFANCPDLPDQARRTAAYGG